MPGLPLMSESTIQIALVLPDLLGTYGDFGNAVVLEKHDVYVSEG